MRIHVLDGPCIKKKTRTHIRWKKKSESFYCKHIPPVMCESWYDLCEKQRNKIYDVKNNLFHLFHHCSRLHKSSIQSCRCSNLVKLRAALSFTSFFFCLYVFAYVIHWRSPSVYRRNRVKREKIAKNTI